MPGKPPKNATFWVSQEVYEMNFAYPTDFPTYRDN